MPDVLRLSEFLHAPVRAPDGADLGRVDDIEVVAGERFPGASALVVSGRGRIAWSDVVSVDASGVVASGVRASAAPAGRLLLVRDVLDAQVVDLVGRRLARVADVDLAHRGGALRAVAVDVGMGAVVRRLGLRTLAERMRAEPLAWDGLYPASGVGHRLQLEQRAADVHRLSHDELQTLIAHLPPERGAEVLAVARPGVHADPLAVARRAGAPRRRFRMMRARRRAPS